jgi:leucyl aminopeptidase
VCSATFEQSLLQTILNGLIARGGISIKPSNNMALMKGDMGGAATVAGALYGICKLGLPLNVTAVTPLCENLPSGRATKPGKWNMK